MKKSDIAMIVFIASVSVLVAYFVGSSLFGNIATKGEKVKTIAPISTTIVQPDPTIFNTRAINPAVQVQITSTTTSPSGTQ
jgi:flagellar basal body-associated protein FliL